MNLENSPTPEFPYHGIYYPGTTEASNAEIISVGLVDNVLDRNIQLPTQLSTLQISGIVNWPDGRPAENSHVYLGYTDEHGDWQFTDSADTDAKGRFSLHGFAGYEYELQANHDDRRISGSDPHAQHAEKQVFTPTRDRSRFRLVLSLPGRE